MAEGSREGTHFCPQCLEKIREDTEACKDCKLPRPPSGWPRDPSTGRLVQQKYKLKERLGSGGFAVVYRARQMQGDLDLGEVALKFLRPHMAENESVRRRFVNEARAARKVSSPHVVKVFDLGFDEDGVPFMAMEYLCGTSLEAEVSARGRLQASRVVGIGLQVTTALAECHSLGIIHRDLKPDNLILQDDGQDGDFVKVLDFGIARVPDPDGTVTHTLMGTPQYMPPEQIMQKEIDGGVDIFALGVILYECLAGRAPIPAETPMEYLQLNLNSTPVPLREVRPELPTDLEVLLGRMMAKDRDQRPASMGDVAMRLKAIRRSINDDEVGDKETIADPSPSRKPSHREKVVSEEALAETMTLPEEDHRTTAPSTQTMQRSLATGGWRRWGLAALLLFGLVGIGIRMAGPGRTGAVRQGTPAKAAPPASPRSTRPAPPEPSKKPVAKPAPVVIAGEVKQPLDAGAPAIAVSRPPAGKKVAESNRPSAPKKRIRKKGAVRPRTRKTRARKVSRPAPTTPAPARTTEASAGPPARVEGL